MKVEDNRRVPSCPLSKLKYGAPFFLHARETCGMYILVYGDTTTQENTEVRDFLCAVRLQDGHLTQFKSNIFVVPCTAKVLLEA
jgi:hypothetical protein